MLEFDVKLTGTFNRTLQRHYSILTYGFKKYSQFLPNIFLKIVFSTSESWHLITEEVSFQKLFF